MAQVRTEVHACRGSAFPAFSKHFGGPFRSAWTEEDRFFGVYPE